MPKKLLREVKLQIPGGKANPAPPVGPALGQYGINIMDFCKKFNEQTSSQEGTVIPVVISIFDDKSFTFIIKNPPVAELLKKALGIEKGSGTPNKAKIGAVTREKILEIAKQKASDFNTDNIDSAVKLIEGTAMSMGVEVDKSGDEK